MRSRSALSLYQILLISFAQSPDCDQDGRTTGSYGRSTGFDIVSSKFPYGSFLFELLTLNCSPIPLTKALTNP